MKCRVEPLKPERYQILMPLSRPCGGVLFDIRLVAPSADKEWSNHAVPRIESGLEARRIQPIEPRGHISRQDRGSSFAGTAIAQLRYLADLPARSLTTLFSAP